MKRKEIIRACIIITIIIALAGSNTPITSVRNVYADNDQNSTVDPSVDGAEVFATQEDIVGHDNPNTEANENYMDSEAPQLDIEGISVEPGELEVDDNNAPDIQSVENAGEANVIPMVSEEVLSDNLRSFEESINENADPIEENGFDVDEIIVEETDVLEKSQEEAISKEPMFSDTEDTELTGECGENATWEINVDTKVLSIFGSGDIDDYASSPWSQFSEDLNKIAISDGITSIGQYAFSGLANVTEVVLPNTIEKIGFRAFYNCQALTAINIPVSWNDCPTSSTSGEINTDYCGHVFEGCESLKEINIPEGMQELPAYAFNYCNNIENISLPSTLTSITHHAFYKCEGLKDIVLPNNITQIGKSAFCRCTNLKNVVLPESLIELRVYSFYMCSSLEEIHLPNSIEKIGYRSFGDCINLRSINIPLNWNECPTASTDNTINADYCGHIFEGCQSLTSLEVPEGITELPGYGFAYCDYLESIILPDSLNAITNHLFYNCKSLKSVTIPSNVTRIGKSAFCYCNNINEVEISNGIESISAFSFYECKSLKALKLPDGLQKIGYRAFANCTSLEAINIPKDWNECVTSSTSGTINADYCGHIFEGCSTLKTVEVPEGVSQLPAYAFNACDKLEAVKLPSTLNNIINHAFYNCHSISEIVVPEGVTFLGKSSFCYCSGLKKIDLPTTLLDVRVYSFYSCTSIEEIELPDSIEKIGYRAFADCTKLKSINIPLSWKECTSSSDSGTVNSSYCGHIFEGSSSLYEIQLPDGITSIPEYGFCYCNYLTTVKLPESIEEIKKCGFYNCASLTYIELPDAVKNIQDYAFYGCSALRAAVFPRSVESLGASSYNNCSSLAVVSIPKEINSIGSNSFGNCSALTYVYFDGNTEEWSGLTKGTEDDIGLSNTTICYGILCDYAEPDFIKESHYEKPSDISYTSFYGGHVGGSNYGPVDINEATFGFQNKKTCISLPKDSFLTYGFSKAMLCPDNAAILLTTSGINDYDERADIYIETITGELVFLQTIYETKDQHIIPLDGISNYVAGIKVIGRDFGGNYPGFDIVDIALIAQKTDESTKREAVTTVYLKRGEKAYDLLKETQKIKADSDEEVSIIVSADWGSKEPGTINIVQNNNIILKNKGGAFVDIQPAQLFESGTAIYVSLVDENDEIVDTEKIKLVIEKDTELIDNTPTIPKARLFSAVEGTVNKDGKLFFDFDENDFANTSEEYNHELGKATSALSLLAYSTKDALKEVIVDKLRFKSLYTFNNQFEDHYGIYSPYAIAHKKIILDGKETELLVVIIRGTYHEEWLDDFDSGTSSVHEGFDRASQHLLKGLKYYTSEEKFGFDKKANLKILVTGHSRGGAVANLVGKELDDGKLDCNYDPQDVFVYTYATPNTAKIGNNSQYNNIFNIVNPEDFVTKVLPSKWGYGRYGVTYVLPSKTTEGSGKGNYVNYNYYLSQVKGWYSSTHAKEEYTPYNLGMYTLASYVTAVTTTVRNVESYYKKDLLTGVSTLTETPTSLHSLYKYALGGSQSKNSKLETLSKAVMGDALVGGYGRLGQETIGFFFTNHILQKTFATAHTAETYYASMLCLKKKEIKQPRKIILGIVNCPVDVAVKDEEGNVVGKITNNVVDDKIDEGIIMDVKGDSKIFCIPEDMDYSVQLTGNDNGSMDYSLCEIDADSGEISREYYEDISVEKNEEFNHSINKGTPVNELDLIDIDGKSVEGVYIDESTADYLSVDVKVEGIGNADSKSNLLPGDYVMLKANTDDNNDFLGWYDEEGIQLSKDDEYAFSIHKDTVLVAKFTNNIVKKEQLSFDEKKVKLVEGEFWHTDVKVEPSNATKGGLVYSSSNNEVVTIDNIGVVKAVGEGSALITVTDEETNLTSECMVEVTHNWDSGTITKEANCNAEGIKTYTCVFCEKTREETISKTQHVFGNWLTTKNATTTTEGIKERTCEKCGLKEKQSTPKIKEVKAKENNSVVSQPSGVKIKKLKAGKKKVTVKWKKGTNINGYQIAYGTSRNLKKAKIKTIKKAKTTSVVIKKLKSKKRYYFKIRTYKIVSGKTYYSNWSVKKKIKVK